MFPSWGIQRELAVQDLPILRVQRYKKEVNNEDCEVKKLLSHHIFNYFLSQSTRYMRKNA